MSAGTIRLDNVTLGYERRPAVHHLTGVIGPGAALAVCGPNGAGKSTLLKGLAGLLSPIGGRILREGLSLRDIAYLPQATEIDASFPIDVLDFVSTGAARRVGLFGRIDRSESARIEAAIAAVGLEGFEDRQLGALSGGQTQRALFARLIVEDRPVVLLDEPFGAIDAATIDDLVKIIAGWREERRSIVAVLHELDLAAAPFRRRCCSRASRSSGGRRAKLCPRAVSPRRAAWSRPSTARRMTVGATRPAMLHELLIAPFADYEFMRRALVGAVALAISGSPLGVFLILRRMSLAGDALSHAILPGAAVGYLVCGLSLPAMTFGGLAAGLTVAVVSSAAARFTALREDASLAAFYLVSLALGVAIVSLKGSNVDLLHVLFGSVLALDDQTLDLSRHDRQRHLVRPRGLLSRAGARHARSFVRAARQPAGRGHALRLSGARRAQSRRRLSCARHIDGGRAHHAAGRLGAAVEQDLSTTLPLAAAIGALSAYFGLVLSFASGLPAGPVIILVAGGVYFLSLIFGRAGGVMRLRQPRRHLEG